MKELFWYELVLLMETNQKAFRNMVNNSKLCYMFHMNLSFVKRMIDHSSFQIPETHLDRSWTLLLECNGYSGR
jgi:hypothetical protein